MDIKCNEYNNFIKESEFVPNVIFAEMAKFLRKPILPPSGVSQGHIMPYVLLCNEWGARILAPLGIEVFNRLK